MKRHFIIILIVLISLLFGCGKESQIVEEDYNLDVEGGRIFGTLTLPKEGNSFKVVIIHQGSGPTDRDGNSHIGGSNNSLKMIAHELAENNIASIRFDKRGIAASMALIEKEEDLVFEDYINDLTLWVEKAKSDSRFSKIYLLGHSEGALIASVAATKSEIDGFISIAGAGYSAYDTLVRQLSTQPKEITDIAIPIMDKLMAGELVNDVPQMFASLFRQSVQPYLISWFKYDPVQVYGMIDVPVLIIQGDNDIQITIEDANRLAESINKQAEIIPGMNHVLKDAPTDYEENLKTYQIPDLQLHPQLMGTIINFINSN